ncbi:MAG: carbonic anhydrase [Bacteroidales bacterium]|nr:carbonic anhydrase [Bacteroidales bacterium]
MDRLIPILKTNDIPEKYIQTPVAQLLEYHDLNTPFETYDNAQLLIGMCMDNRKNLNIPDNFAYIIRTGGGNLRYSEFKVSYAIAIGKVKYIVLIGHSNCGMVDLFSKKEAFISGLVEEAGWQRDWAEDHFIHFSPMFEIGSEIDFLMSETKRLRLRYSKINIVPMYYQLEDNKLYLIEEH